MFVFQLSDETLSKLTYVSLALRQIRMHAVLLPVSRRLLVGVFYKRRM